MIFRSLVLTHFLLLFLNSAQASTPHTAENALAVKRIAQVAPAPSGTQTAYNVIQLAGNISKQWQALVYLHTINGKNILLSDPADIAYMINWSHNERYISYVVNNTSGQHLYLYDTQTQQTRKLRSFSSPISAYKWSPDDKIIAYVSADKNAHNNSRLYYFSIDNINQSVVVTPKNISISAATPNPALDGGFDWSPNNKQIAYSYQPKVGENYLNDAKIAISNIYTNETIQLPYTQSHTGGQPRYSYDGESIAFRTNVPASRIAPALNHNAAINNQICVAHLHNKSVACFENTPNENPTILGWHPNNKSVYVEDTFQTSGHQIYLLTRDKKAELISKPSDGVLENSQLNASGTQLGFALERLDKPVEVYVSQTTLFDPKQISKLQTSMPSALPSSSVINWKSTDGTNIQGILLLPPNYNPAKKYPLIVGIHGGPEGVWAQRYIGSCEGGGTMTIPPCWGVMATKGFIILLPNPRGSTGYGRSFRTANFADWGGRDYEDIMSGVDMLIRKQVADANHLGVAGWSYGGYMTNWIATQTNQFKVAVDGAGMSNLISFFKSTDLINEAEEYFGVSYEKDPSLYRARSPITHIEQVKTPILIVHGDDDTRVPFTQGTEWQKALLSKHKMVKLHMMPKQAHIPTDPSETISAIHAIEDWLEKVKY